MAKYVYRTASSVFLWSIFSVVLALAGLWILIPMVPLWAWKAGIGLALIALGCSIFLSIRR